MIDMRTKLRQRLQLLLCAFGILLWILAGAFQFYTVAAEELGSITMICQTEEGLILEGVNWKLYRVGERTDENELELKGVFRRYPVYLGNPTESVLRDAAETLDTYIEIGKIEPDAEEQADAGGRLKFSSLTNGLYLLIGDHVSVGTNTYGFSPFLIEVPAPDTHDLDLIAYPKGAAMNMPELPVEYTVRKFWKNDEDMPEMRSVSITANIYRDGVLYESVVLDESNDWTYSWTSHTFHKWKVEEDMDDIPVDYAVVYKSNGVQFVIENTYHEDFYFWEEESLHTSIVETTETTHTNTTPVTDTSATSASTSATQDTTASASQTTVTETTNTTSTTITAVSSTGSTTGSSATTVTTVTTAATTSKPEKLPQTGQLWWPVPLLAVAGLFSITAGLKLHSKE